MEQAAAALTAVAEGSIALAILASLEPDGRIVVCNAVGAADSRSGAELRTESLTSRVYRVSKFQLGSWRPGAKEPLVARLSELAPDWRTNPVGRVWPQPPRGELIMAASGPADGPSLVTILEAPGDVAVVLDVLSVVLPMLAEAAVRILGGSATDPRLRLTGKERQVLEQLAVGRSVKQIAESLDRSPHTVHDHVKALHRKLDASTRGELIAKALGHLPPSGSGDDHSDVRHSTQPRSGSARSR